MKGYSQLNKMFSILLIFILLSQLSGCIGFKNISRNELPTFKSGNYHYTIHSKNSKYPIESTVILNGILSGKVDFKHSYRRNSIQVYVSSGTVIKINKENILSIPLESVTKVKKSKFAVGRTISVVIGSSFTLMVLLTVEMFLQLKHY
jgi:hypothetical protein